MSRYADVSVDVSGRDVAAEAAAISEKLAGMQFPLEYHAELLTDYADVQAAQSRWRLTLIAAAVGMFLLVQAAVGSWRLGAVSVVALAAALSGSAIVMLVTGNTLTLAATGGLLCKSARKADPCWQPLIK